MSVERDSDACFCFSFDSWLGFSFNYPADPPSHHEKTKGATKSKLGGEPSCWYLTSSIRPIVGPCHQALSQFVQGWGDEQQGWWQMTDDEDKMMAEVINLLLFAPLEFSLLSFPARATTSAIKIEEQLNRNSIYTTNANANNTKVIFINNLAKFVDIPSRHDVTLLCRWMRFPSHCQLEPAPPPPWRPSPRSSWCGRSRRS